MRLSPNAITLLGLPIGGATAFFLYEGQFWPAAFGVASLSACDLLDGTLARKKGLTSSFGAFLDSTIDRITELFLFMGLFFFYVREGELWTAAAAYWALGGSLVTSYARARAENFIENCRVGFWERPERLLGILLGLLTGRLKTVLWILAFGVTGTASYRILHTWAILNHKTLFLRHHPRTSWPYRIYAAVVILLALSLRVP